MTGPAEVPRVWILWRRRKGDLDQMLCLARALGWPFAIKTLRFAPPDVPLLAPLLLQTSRSDRLEPPWPDLVICAEALPSIIARRLKARSQGRIRTVCLAKPAGDPACFDLVITTAQYRLPRLPNVLELGLPLSDAAPSPSTTRPEGPPRLAVAVGGSSFPDRLDAAAARQLALDLMAHATASGAVLDVVTSPRTGETATAALRESLTAPHQLHPFVAGPRNPYAAVLAAASAIVVTSDSVSMVADALATGKPVSVYRLPQTRNLQWRLTEWLHTHAVTAPTPWLRPVTQALNLGLFEIPADRHLLFDRLARDGRLGWFGDPAPAHAKPADAAARDLDHAVARVKALLA